MKKGSSPGVESQEVFSWKLLNVLELKSQYQFHSLTFAFSGKFLSNKYKSPIYSVKTVALSYIFFSGYVQRFTVLESSKKWSSNNVNYRLKKIQYKSTNFSFAKKYVIWEPSKTIDRMNIAHRFFHWKLFNIYISMKWSNLPTYYTCLNPLPLWLTWNKLKI